jgi:hypothetical protein
MRLQSGKLPFVGSEDEFLDHKGNKVIADRLCRLPCEVVDFKAGQDCDEGH